MKNEEVTLKNTKAEILDALNAALEREKNLSKVKSDPIKEEKEKKEQKAIEVSRENVEQKIFSDELINKFKNLEIAILAEEEKLKELYGIEKELYNLTVIVNAGKDCMSEIEKNKETETEKLKNSIKELEEEYKLKSEKLKKDFETEAKNLKIERDREVEEYNYKTKREREISNNKWEDEKRKREENLSIREQELNKLLEESKAKEEYSEELEEKVEKIPELLAKEYEKGKSEATTVLEKEHKYAIELLKKDFKNTIDRQEDKIISLKEELEKSNNLNSILQEKLDKAYIEVKELATKTVEATGGVKILGNGQSDNK